MRTDAGPPGLTALLRSQAVDFHRLSAADIVSLFLYDEASRRYFGPVAVGQPEDSLRESLSDMQSQLDRYLADVAQNKAPDDLHVPHYGSTVWLTITRQVLEARDAGVEIDSTFVRRHRVQSVLGLPLIAGDRVVGLVYLDYCARPDAAGRPRLPGPDGVAELKQLASESAREIEAAVAAAERAALAGTRRLISLLVPVDEQDGASRTSLRRQLSIALADLLMVSRLDAAVVYEREASRGALELVTAHAPAAAPARVDLPAARDGWETALSGAVGAAMAGADLHVVAVHPLGEPQEVASRRLIGTLTNSNRLLGALSRMSSAMLRPGSSRQQVLAAVASHLTDAAIPDFDFDFATVYLLDQPADSPMVVRLAAGTVMSEAIASAEVGDGGARVPRWALEHEREVAPDDVLAFVARFWQVVLVGPAADDLGRREGELIAGTMLEQLRWVQAPVVGSGVTRATVPACLIGRPAGSGPAPAGDPPFTLAADIFESSGHADLIRLFLPFGLDGDTIATGVLEVGYHRSLERRPDWAQVEALRAAAAQVAVGTPSSSS